MRDRLTWMRFLGLGLGDPVPDANTIWTFREALTKAGAIERLFTLYDQQLRARGYLAMSGQLVDASIVAAPKQRMPGRAWPTCSTPATPLRGSGRTLPTARGGTRRCYASGCW